MREELAQVEADAAGPDDRDARARRLPAEHDVGVPRDLRMIDAGNRRRAGDDAGRQHDMIEAGEIASGNPPVQRERDAGALDPAPEVAQRFRETRPCPECAAQD